MFFISLNSVDHANSEFFSSSRLPKLSPSIGVNNEILIIFDWDIEFFIPLLSTFISWFFTISRDDTYTIVSLSSLDLSVNNPDCKRNEGNK